ncbi:vanadium-dependent haloperoxidase [Bacillus sp. SM2101]|uniref:vanadium-dependent haloperoxidase n=1 Tax=Bacillaceae TaxID=186817 RepID=UPI001BDF61BB|nr:vanadium-dependent haloperoxidase [Bacillus sp. SM2101]
MNCNCLFNSCECKCTYERWNEIPYAGESEPPKNPEEPYAGSWSTYYIKRCGNQFITLPNKEPIYFSIKNPNYIDWNEQLEKVLEVRDNLDDHKKTVAKYWGTGVATKQWTPIIDRLIDTYGVTAPRAARILGAVQSAINDAFVITWFYKFLWLVARPDQLDQELATVVCTPRHPTYPSGHAAVAGCAAELLKYFFPGESLRLDELAEECAISRLYGLVHFPIDNDEGLSLGRQIGQVVVNNLKKEVDSQCDPIDTPYEDNLHADLMPPPYEQVIPFDFNTECQSLVIPDDD